jgi:hypothetical protein
MYILEKMFHFELFAPANLFTFCLEKKKRERERESENRVNGKREFEFVQIYAVYDSILEKSDLVNSKFIQVSAS